MSSRAPTTEDFTMHHPDLSIPPDLIALSIAMGAFGALSRDAMLTFAVGIGSPLLAGLLRAVLKPIAEHMSERLAARLRRRLAKNPAPAAPCAACGGATSSPTNHGDSK